MRTLHHRGFAYIFALLLVTVAGALLLCTYALGEAGGAVLAPITPKPWLAAPATATPASAMPENAADYLVEGEVSQTAAPASSGFTTPAGELTLPGVLKLADPTRLRILLIGTDAYNPDDRGRSDTMVLVQVDVQRRDIRMVSFLRDLYVKIQGHGKTRLNAAYVYGGEALLLQTLQNNFGVSADRTLAVNFSRMVELIDRIGGVTVEVSEKERKQLNSILKYYNTQSGYKQKDQLLEQSGVVTLTGKQALCYSRIRKLDSDFQRTGRQRKVLMGIFQRVRGMDPLALAGLLTQSYTMVKTDLSLADIAALVPVLMQLGDATFDSLTIPVSGGYESITVNGSDVLSPNLEENRTQIEAFLR